MRSLELGTEPPQTGLLLETDFSQMCMGTHTHIYFYLCTLLLLLLSVLKFKAVYNQSNTEWFLVFYVFLAPPSKPEASCNDSGDAFALKCTADFSEPLHYTWKLNSIPPIVRDIPEVFITKKDVGASTKAVCFIKFSQTERSSEISLTQCFSGKKGNEPSMGCK